MAYERQRISYKEGYTNGKPERLLQGQLMHQEAQCFLQSLACRLYLLQSLPRAAVTNYCQ